MVFPRARTLLITLGLLATLATGSSAALPDDTDQAALRAYYSANGLLNRGLYELAVAEYEAFLDTYPDHAKTRVARYGLGVSLFRLGRYDEAAAELAPLRAARTAEYAAEIATVLGQCYLTTGQYDDAAGCLEVVLDEHAESPLADDAAALLTEALYRAGRYERVPAVCAGLVERWPASGFRERAELFSGLSAMARGRYAEAARQFEASSRRFPDGASAGQRSLLLAQCLHQSGDLRRAREQYGAVMGEADDAFAPDATYGLAVLDQQEGRPEPAGALLDALIAAHPDHRLVPAARVLRGRVYFDLEAYDLARAQFALAEQMAPDRRRETGYWIAKCDLRTGDAGAAVARLRRAMKTGDETLLAAEMQYDLAVALVRNGDDDDAMVELERFLDRFSNDALAPAALHLAARTLHRQRSYDESLALCERFGARYADHALAGRVRFLVAENEYLAGNLDAAVDAYRHFLDLAGEPDTPADADDPIPPEDPGALERAMAGFRLGMALYQLDRLDDAEPRLVAAAAAGDASEDLTFAAAHLALGDLHFRRGAWADAAEHLEAYLANGLDQPSADDALLKLGLARQRLGDDDDALVAFDQLLDAFAASVHRPQALFERGQTLVALEDPAEAAEAFGALLEEHPDTRFTVHALNHLGAIALARGAYDEAAARFGEVAAAAEDSALAAEALFQQGQALARAGDLESAAEVLGTLLSEDEAFPRRAVARARLAIALARLSRHAEALAEIETLEADAANLDDEHVAAVLYEKAWCLRALDRDREAAATYAALLARPLPASLGGHARLELAELLTQEGKLDESAALLHEALDASAATTPRDPELHGQALYRLGVCELSRGNDAAAAERLEAFADTYPRDELAESANLLAGEALFRIGAHRRAVSRLEAVVGDLDRKASPRATPSVNHAPALLRLGECLAVLQKWRRSEAVFAAFLAQHGDSDVWFQAQFGLGWAYENQGRTEDAIAAYRRIIARHQGPTAARAQFQIGECLFAEEQYAEAARELLKVDILYAYPEWSAAALYEAGRCFAALADPVSARNQFEQVKREHGGTTWATLATTRLEEMARAAALPGR